MAKKNKSKEDESLKDIENGNEDLSSGEQIVKEDNIMDSNDTADDMDLIKKQLEVKENELKEYVDVAQRVKAEFDNYKKRTLKEREQLYTDVKGDIISKFLPIMDNLERAVSSDSLDSGSITEGIDMILKQFKEILSKEDVSVIETPDQKFDPNFHNAVMHVEDDSFEPNTIVEVFQKGYKINDKVLRHSMVKVAN